MNQEKIGKFIANQRKKENLTQLELAEKLSVSDRAVSKWERGKSMPDSAIMLNLCKILKISVNELLYGEKIDMENFKEKYEQAVIEMVKQKEEKDRQLLSLEIVIGVLSMIILLGCCIVAAYVEMPDYLRIILIVAGAIPCFIGVAVAIKIEQTAGYYECRICGHKHVPKYSSVLFAMHINRTRYLKCPKCNQTSWQKKVISNE